MEDAQESAREKLIKLYHERLSKRYKRYYDPESSEVIPPTPAKKLCQREGSYDYQTEQQGRDEHQTESPRAHREQHEDALHTQNFNEDAANGSEAFLPHSVSHDRISYQEEENNGSDFTVDEGLSDNEDDYSNSTVVSSPDTELYGTTDQEEDGDVDFESSDIEDHETRSDTQDASSNDTEASSPDYATHGTTDQEEDGSNCTNIEADRAVSANLENPRTCRVNFPDSNSRCNTIGTDQVMYEVGEEDNLAFDGTEEDEICDEDREEESDNSECNEEDEGRADDREDEENTTSDEHENEEERNSAGDEDSSASDGNEEDNDLRQQRKRSLMDLIDGDYSEPIDTGVDVTRSDLLYMALGTAKQNNFTNKAFNDSIQLLNRIFTAPVLPVSSKQLDSLLVDKTGVKYYFYCNTCEKAFGELDYQTIKTKVCDNEHCGAVNVISDLRKAHYFCMFDLSNAIEVLLNQSDVKDKLLKPADAVNKEEPGFISDIYGGSMYKDFARRVADYTECVISLHFCTDGAPLFKSSLNSIWPIMFCINELPAAVRMKNILLGGLWFGKSQPPMNLLLEPLSGQAVRLSNGFRIHVKNEPLEMRAFITGCCVDSGARGKVQGVKTHGGYYACNWCLIKGVHIVVVKYPMAEECPQKRTHSLMLRLVNKIFGEVEEELSDDELIDEENLNFGVIDASPLINLPMFDMVSGFFVEPMHLLDLGITKAHLTRWLEEPGDFNISDSINEIDKRLLSLRPPLEFRRMPRKLHEKARAKARELNNWLLYCMYPVLCGILPQRFLKLWLLFAQAVYILSQTVIPHSHVNIADALIKHFIFMSQEYYGETCMVFNMHLLTHLAEHVARWGPLWATSAYCFENFNGFLLKIIRSQNGIPSQVIRALSWRQALLKMQPFVSEKAKQFVKSLPSQRKTSFEVDGCLLLGNSSLFTPSEEEMWFCERFGYDIDSCEEYLQLARNNCVFSKPQRTSKTNNSVAQLIDKSIVQIRKIVHDRQKEVVFLFASKVHTEACISMPQGIQLDLADHCVRKVTHIEEELCCLSSADLKIVCFYTEFEYGNFVIPLANVCNTF